MGHQYARLWEYCGHFARSFAADDLWREQGHACGEDVVALLQDVESACVCLEGGKKNSIFIGSINIEEKTKGQVNLHSLSGLVHSTYDEETEDNEAPKDKKSKSKTLLTLDLAEKLLNQQSQ